MTPTSIVFLDRDTLPPETTLRAPDLPHEITVHARTAPEDVAARIAEADVVITNKVPITADAIAHAPKLKLLAVAATGTDVIDLAACKAAGVTVSNIRDYARHTVPEHTFALILALRRSLLAYRQSVLDGRWEEAAQFCYFDYPISDLAGSTLGIVGSGVLGRAVSGIAQGFGMRVVFAARKDGAATAPGHVPFDEVMRSADIITLHCPLMPETRNLIGPREFDLMTRRPLVINTGRGGLVDEAALVAALDAGKIAGAGFDVLTREPPGAEHPLRKVAGRPNVILTPHVAWASAEAIQGLADQLIDNIEGFCRGEPSNVVV